MWSLLRGRGIEVWEGLVLLGDALFVSMYVCVVSGSEQNSSLGRQVLNIYITSARTTMLINTV